MKILIIKSCNCCLYVFSETMFMLIAYGIGVVIVLGEKIIRPTIQQSTRMLIVFVVINVIRWALVEFIFTKKRGFDLHD
jgi:hypothetical protein